MTVYARGLNFDDASIVAVSLDTGERTVLIEGGSDARYVDSGHLVYIFEQGLFAVAFDAQRLQTTSGPVSLVGAVNRSDTSTRANFEVTDNGALFYVSGAAGRNPLVWVDRSGRAEVIESIPPNEFRTPRLSPDGERVMAVADGDVRIFDLASGRETRLTTKGRVLNYADWTPSGREIAFTASWGSDGEEIWIQASDGSAEARQLTTLDGRIHFDDWAPDARTFSAHRHDTGINSQLMVAYDGEGAEPETWLERDFPDTNAVFSADGRYVVMVSGQSGEIAVYIRPFPGPGGMTPVSVGGGSEPAWSENGEVFYRRAEDYTMMAVEVSTDPVLSVGEPVELFAGVGRAGSPRASYAVTSDGQRFLMSASAVGAADTTSIVIVQNWIEELKERVPN